MQKACLQSNSTRSAGAIVSRQIGHSSSDIVQDLKLSRPFVAAHWARTTRSKMADVSSPPSCLACGQPTSAPLAQCITCKLSYCVECVFSSNKRGTSCCVCLNRAIPSKFSMPTGCGKNYFNASGGQLPDKTITVRAASRKGTGCQVCSASASFTCACKQVRYCGKSHQTADWKYHRAKCSMAKKKK
jgi:hypothetical protein